MSKLRKNLLAHRGLTIGKVMAFWGMSEADWAGIPERVQDKIIDATNYMIYLGANSACEV